VKILIASILPVDDITSWSGTCNAIYQQLTKNNEVKICYSPFAHSAQKRLAKYSYLYNKITGKRLNVYFSRSIAKVYATKLANDVEIFTPDLILCLGSGTEIYAYTPYTKTVLVADASFNLLQDEYPNYTNLNKSAILESQEVEAASLAKFHTIFTTSSWAMDGFKSVYPRLNYKLINLGSNLAEGGYEKNLFPSKKEDIKLLTIGTDYKRKGIAKAQELADNMLCQLIQIGTYITIDKTKIKDVNLLTSFYKNAHFFVLFPKADCTPIVINEANSFGLPVIAYPVGGIPTMIKHGTNGYIVNDLIEAKAQIEYAIANPNIYKALRKSTFQYYNDNLSWDIFEQKLLAE
jgi:glycosyltransferase involved in cell wall biosynthesis